MTFNEAMRLTKIFPKDFDKVNMDGLREKVKVLEELGEDSEAYKMMLEFLEKRKTVFENAIKIYRLYHTLYFIFDKEDSMVLGFDADQNEWFPRNSVSFWDAWDDGPLLYEIVKIEDAKKLVKEAGGSYEEQQLL